MHWWVGDWAIYGENQYGDAYAEIVEATGLNYQMVADDKYVCGRIQFSSRNENLTFKHHRVVAPLPLKQQDRWLARAEKEGWSAGELRRQIKLAAALGVYASRFPLLAWYTGGALGDV